MEHSDIFFIRTEKLIVTLIKVNEESKQKGMLYKQNWGKF